MRPMRLPVPSVNHSVPSGATDTVVGPLLGFGSANSVTVPSVCRLPFRCAPTDATASSMTNEHSQLREADTRLRRGLTTIQTC